jgi:hypothetical protein
MQVLLRFFRDEWKARHDEDDSGFSNEGWWMINANPPRQTNGVRIYNCEESTLQRNSHAVIAGNPTSAGAISCEDSTIKRNPTFS